jgi:hypothetical protein
MHVRLSLVLLALALPVSGADPAKLVPNTLLRMPDVSSGAMTIAFRLKPGIRFTGPCQGRSC